MRKTRLLLASCITACLAVPVASPAVAQEEAECPPGWVGQFPFDLIPPIPAFQPVELDEETITIRGDLVVAEAGALADHYVSTTEGFLSCLQQYVDERATPYRSCLEGASAPILTSPDPVGRYVEVGADLVVKVHYAQAVRDVAAVFNCNGIVTYGDPPQEG